MGILQKFYILKIAVAPAKESALGTMASFPPNDKQSYSIT